jgi:phosphatidylserine decarboxylase
MSLIPTIQAVLLVPIHPKGRMIIMVAVAITAVLFSFSLYAGWIGVVGVAFCTYFFRNPNRMVPQGDGFVLATGDGVISHLSQTTLPKELNADGALYHKISIFLNVFNVHVNRVPATGQIMQHHYIPGMFFNAALDKASDDNERTVTMMKTASGHTIGFSQIAGLVARRIICDISANQHVQQGERYGIIRFGSRCDVYIPLHYAVLVDVGSIAVGGETLLAVDRSIFAPEKLTWKKI